MKRDWIDAKFEVVGEPPKPTLWPPYQGLGPIATLVCVAITGLILFGLKLLIYPPISAAVGWLFRVTGIGSG